MAQIHLSTKPDALTLDALPRQYGESPSNLDRGIRTIPSNGHEAYLALGFVHAVSYGKAAGGWYSLTANRELVTCARCLKSSAV